MKATTHTRDEGAARLRHQIVSALRRPSEWTTRQITIAIFCFAVVITLGYRPFSQMVIGDTAFYDYIAQSILRGQLPYRDTVDIKFPGAVYLSALAMAVGHLFGLRDVLAVRALYLLLTGLFSALIFLVALNYLRAPLAGAIAALIPIGLPRFGEWVTSGTEPKLPLMVAGLLALLMIAKDRPFWAGFCGMLACLFWQPGLMFVGAAGLVFSRYLTTWRDLRAVKVIIGAAVPLAFVFLYFYLKDALGDLWAWTITYNYSVFGPDAERGVIEAVAHVWKISVRVFQNQIALVPLSLIGFAFFAAARLKEKRHLRRALQSEDLYRDALVWPPLVYFAFSLVNFQAGPDLLPFLPFIALFAGWFFVEAGRWLAAREFLSKQLSRQLSKRWPRVEWRTALPALAFGLLMLVALFNSVTFRLSGWSLRGQEDVLKPVTSQLGPDDKIYVHGTTELLVLTNRANLNPYLFLDWGADEFAAARRGVPFSELVAEMDAEAPKVVALSRLKVVRRRDDFLRWVEAHYTPLNVPGYENSIYIRKP